jgi:hypothetical protein
MIIPHCQFELPTPIGVVSNVQRWGQGPGPAWAEALTDRAYELAAALISWLHPSNNDNVDNVVWDLTPEILQQWDDNADRVAELVSHHFGESPEAQLRSVELFIANHFTEFHTDAMRQAHIVTRIAAAEGLLHDFFREDVRIDLSGYRGWFESPP